MGRCVRVRVRVSMRVWWHVREACGGLASVDEPHAIRMCWHMHRPMHTCMHTPMHLHMACVPVLLAQKIMRTHKMVATHPGNGPTIKGRRPLIGGHFLGERVHISQFYGDITQIYGEITQYEPKIR